MAEELVAREFSHYLLVDRGYDCDVFQKKLTERGITPVIPGKKIVSLKLSMILISTKREILLKDFLIE